MGPLSGPSGREVKKREEEEDVQGSRQHEETFLNVVATQSYF